MATLQVAKKELRQHMKATLSAVCQDDIARQTSVVVRTMQSLPEYQRARRISIFLSMPTGEISTAAIVRDALVSGKEVFVPYTYKATPQRADQPSSVMDMVEIRSTDDHESLMPDKWGIPTPSDESIPNRQNSFGGKGITNHSTTPSMSGLDLIVMPGMAFDSQVGRLGHGKGFYDYFLWRCSQVDQRRMPYLVGIALKEQLLPEGQTVPTDQTDWRLDALVIGDGRVLAAPI